ncbi:MULTISPECIES: IS1/IS1595 family N-terminal zinc-binding domain-containing protein [unclassified Variovorax]|uniref:IS1/IS1595 family N-terminal zinc-binding domain-containing protein n=1 Tax=unclassified Variovorax TaxID=663243 RepID=UPI003F513573
MLGRTAASCPNEKCENDGKAIGEPGHYARFGKTRFGTARWRCNSCGKTFTDGGNPLLIRQRKTHKNRDVFMMLMGLFSLRRCCTFKEGLTLKAAPRGAIKLRATCGRWSAARMAGLWVPSYTSGA